MSTGDELIEATEQQPHGAQIRDSNRPSLLAAFQQDGYEALDLGIVRDTVEVLRSEIARAVSLCDVVVTSGGVSMGEADYVKTILQELGTVCVASSLPLTVPGPLWAAEHEAGQADHLRLHRQALWGRSVLLLRPPWQPRELPRLQGAGSRPCPQEASGTPVQRSAPPLLCRELSPPPPLRLHAPAGLRHHHTALPPRSLPPRVPPVAFPPFVLQ
jgi:hypothetical protein